MADRSRVLRILAVAPTSFFADYGCHVRILQQIAALQERGHEIRLLTYPTGRDVPGIRTSRARGWPAMRGPQIGPRPAKILLDASLLAHTFAQARRWPADVVIGYLHEGALIGRAAANRLRAPLAFDYQGSLAGELAGYGWLKPGRPAYRLVRGLERRIHRRADLILCSSRHAEAALRSDGDCSRVVAFPDRVDTAFFDPDRFPDAARGELKVALGIPADRKVIVYLGLLGRHQGTHHLLRAIAAWPADAPPAHFVIMGYPRADAYRRLAEEMGVAARVTFTGKISYDDAPRYLSIGDMAVAPKVSDTEGHGKLLNYMAMRLPTVAFDSPVSREYLGDWGRYAPVGDSDALARQLAELAASADAQAIGAALRARAQAEFAAESLGPALEQALLSIAGGSTAR